MADLKEVPPVRLFVTGAVDAEKRKEKEKKRRVRWEIKMKMEIKIKGSARPYEWELDLFLCVRAVYEKRGALAVPCHLDESPLVCYYPTRPAPATE